MDLFVAKLSIFRFKNFRIFIQKKKSCALKVAVLEFQKWRKK